MRAWRSSSVTPEARSIRVGRVRNESGGDCRDGGMTQIDERTGQGMEQQVADGEVCGEQEPTPAEVLEWRRDDVFLPEADADPEEYPHLRNISAGFIFGGVVRPLEPAPPEYVTLPAAYTSTEEFLAIAQWNMLWEAAQFRRRFFDLDDLPEPMARIADLGDVNVTFVPRTRARYFEYAPLFHLLPKRVLDMFGLPLLRGGQWPFMADWSGIDDFLPPDFEVRLARAWAWTVWPHLVSGSKMKAFSADDPIRLLAHNLDFWVPAVTAPSRSACGTFPRWTRARRPVRSPWRTAACSPGPWPAIRGWADRSGSARSTPATPWSRPWRPPTGPAGCAASSTRFGLTGSRTTSPATGPTPAKTSNASCTASAAR